MQAARGKKMSKIIHGPKTSNVDVIWEMIARCGGISYVYLRETGYWCVDGSSDAEYDQRRAVVNIVMNV
jgi:hypothetical protein